MRNTRLTTGDRILDGINYGLLILVALAILYPLYFIVIASFSSPRYVAGGQVWLLPKGASLDGYARIFRDDTILVGYRNTLLYTVAGTLINLAVTLPAGYALSRRDLVGRNALMFLFTFTMFFSGGMIPTYILVRGLGLINTIWAMLLPCALSVYYLIICRTFFQTTIPGELREAAVMDGCSNAGFFLRVVLPVSPALVAVMVLFYGVNHWNSFFDALLYLNNEDRYPLQYVLRNILIANAFRTNMLQDTSDSADKQLIVDMIKYGVIIVSSIPVLVLYPFLQKYFIQGVMIGSIKG